MTDDNYPTTYRLKPHQFVIWRQKIPYAICTECGFINLKNDFSAWSNDKGCYSELHPDYKRMRNKAGKK